jgi:hypothetical protein
MIKKTDINPSISNNMLSLNDFINKINKYLIGLDEKILIDNVFLVKEIEAKSNSNNIFVTISLLLYNIIIIHSDNIDKMQKQLTFSKLYNMKNNEILRLLNGGNNIFIKSGNSINYSLFLYEFI